MDKIAVAGLVVSTVSAIAAMFATYYAKGSPTREDLKEVENNTAATAQEIKIVRGHIAQVENHLRLATDRQDVLAAGQQAVILIRGDGPINTTYHFIVTSEAGSELRIAKIELSDPAGMVYGRFPCYPTESGEIWSAVDSNSITRFAASSKATSGKPGRGVIRVFISTQGGEAIQTVFCELGIYMRYLSGGVTEAAMTVSGRS